VADIGGQGSEAWLGMANALATAATVPFVGAISDLIGRRIVAISGSLLVIAGMVVVGFAQEMDVAIGGSAIVGVGAGLTEAVGTAAIMEIAPVRKRGKYIGVAFLLLLPFGGCPAYGLSASNVTNVCSSIVLGGINLEVGSVDSNNPLCFKSRSTVYFLSSTAASQ
jgi:MFS family permease